MTKFSQAEFCCSTLGEREALVFWAVCCVDVMLVCYFEISQAEHKAKIIKRARSRSPSK